MTILVSFIEFSDSVIKLISHGIIGLSALSFCFIFYIFFKEQNKPEPRSNILNGLKFETFYELSIVDGSELVDDWISIRESGQLRINYNMTDWTPIGSKIELKIEQINVDFYK